MMIRGLQAVETRALGPGSENPNAPDMGGQMHWPSTLPLGPGSENPNAPVHQYGELSAGSDYLSYLILGGLGLFLLFKVGGRR
jgi:hypothetical protein